MANVNSDILVWCREQAGLSVEDAARLLRIQTTKTASAEEKLLAYEGGKEPSRAMLKEMARVYRRPILTFYLSEPPIKTDKGEDFRSLPADIDPQQNFLVDVLIRDIKARQSIIRQTLIDEDEAEPHPFIGRYTIHDGVRVVADAIYETFDIDLGEFRSQTNYQDAFKYLRKKLEDRGIFVLLKGNISSYHTNIDLNVFRGFALSDDIAPIIVINPQEARSARAFTLLHELVHLLLGQTGVSSTFVGKKIEKFCDAVASECLLPNAEFSDFTPETTDFEHIKEEIAFYAQDRRISNSQVAYRCLQRGLIDKNLWRKLSGYFYEKFLENKQKEKEAYKGKDGGPNQTVIRKSYLGELVNFAQRMSLSGALSVTKAGVVLGVKPLKVHTLFSDAPAM